ncbi:MAG: hypothetical protein HQM14_06515 [SAR324 cluster bacterium]|nr:hypothetical protein [SAR324 cluster bacterium]
MPNKKRYQAIGIAMLCSVVLFACSSPSERFRSRSGSEYSLRYETPTRLQVTGTGCALDEKTAIRISQNAAKFHLRSIIGNTKYNTTIREINRYHDDGQICIESEIESREP